jgi:hypothetical protein
MTIAFIGIGIVFFIAVAARFASRVTMKEPEASRVK